MYKERSFGDKRKAFGAGVGREVYVGNGRVVVKMGSRAGGYEDCR